MSDGWIKLHRSFLDWEWFTCPKTCQVFIYCMLRANHTDTKWRGVPVKRGQFLTSYEKLSSGTGLSVRNIRTALKNLESTGEVTRESTSQLTKLTICKYGIYNNSDSQGDKPTDKQATNERQTNDKQATTDKKEKNLKNLKNEEEKIEKARVEFEDLAKPLFISLDGMSEYANFCDYWTTQNKLNDTLRFQEDSYFNMSVKVRGWLDKANKGKPTKTVTVQKAEGFE